MPRFSSTLSNLVACAIALTALATPVLADPEFHAFDVTQVTPEELHLDGRNIVSSILPQGSELTLDQIKGAPQANGKLGNVHINSLGDTLLVSRAVPGWLRLRFPGPLQWAKPALEEFRTRDVEMAGNTAKLRGEYDTSRIVATFTDDMRGMLKEDYEAQKKGVADALANKDSVVLLTLTPRVCLYSAGRGEYMGGLRFNLEKPIDWEKSEFRPRKKELEDLPLDSWYHEPALIEPKVDLLAEDATRTITLAPIEGQWSLKDLSQFLNEQGLKFAAPDQKVADQTLFIDQAKSWTTADLLQAVTAVGGVEVDRTPNGYSFRPSPAHQEMAFHSLYQEIARKDYQETLDALAEIFARQGNHLNLPADFEKFRASGPTPLGSLDEATRTRWLAPLDEATRAKVGYVWPILFLNFGIQAPLGQTVGADVVPFPPNVFLNPPDGWNEKETKSLKDKGAKIHF